MSSNEQGNSLNNRRALKRVALTTPSGWLAFGFGSGLSPIAPGTMGTLVAVPFLFVLRNLSGPGFWIALALLFLLGVVFGDVAADFVKGIVGGGSFFCEFCDMVAEFCLEEIADLADFHIEDDIFKFGDHLAAWEVA